MRLLLTISFNERKIWLIGLILFLTMGVMIRGHAQETVFSALRPDIKKAEAYFEQGNFERAVEYYIKLSARRGKEYLPKAAECFYRMHRPKDAVSWYETYQQAGGTLKGRDLELYAESLVAKGSYERAIAVYATIVESFPDNETARMKLWRLRSREFLYEDSAHYVVERMPLNTQAGDQSAVFYREGLVFMSDRERSTVVRRVDERELEFYSLYFVAFDSSASDGIIGVDRKVALFARDLSRYHMGPASFFDNDRQMVYAASDEGASAGRERKLQLYLARRDRGSWSNVASLQFNNSNWNFTDPCVTADGATLYFSSDMPGGFGGYDIYRCNRIDNHWTDPVNLGGSVNTIGDERSAFLREDILYFASNGHPGLGGFDIFRTLLLQSDFGEIQNPGYPLNTNADDFSFVLDGDGNSGFLSSNREGKDDIYRVSIDLQTYPMEIEGVVKYREETWRDTAELQILPGARLRLVDNAKGTIVKETNADGRGMFKLTIPYFSQYHMIVSEPGEDEESVVSLELSRKKTEKGLYEIVVVRKRFPQPGQ